MTRPPVHKVPLFGNPNRTARLEDGATVGAKIGTNLELPDGTIPTLEELAEALGVTEVIDSGRNAVQWAYVLGKPANIIAVAALASSGLVVRKSDGSWTTRSLTTADSTHITVSNGDGDAGAPTVNIGSDVMTLDDAQTVVAAKTFDMASILASALVFDGNVGAATRAYFDIKNTGTNLDRRLMYLREGAGTGFFVDMDFSPSGTGNALMIGSDIGSAESAIMHIIASGDIEFAGANVIIDEADDEALELHNAWRLVLYDSSDTDHVQMYVTGDDLLFNAAGLTDFDISGFTGMNFNGNEVWHAGNDGSGSGLDADTVDGVHATDLLSASSPATVTAFWVFAGDLEVAGLLTLEGGTLADTLANGNNNDYAPTGIDTANRLLLTPDAGGSTITGIAGGSDGRVLIIQNVSTSVSILLAYENANSSAANRFVIQGLSGSTSVQPGLPRLLVYNGSYLTGRWAVMD